MKCIIKKKLKNHGGEKLLIIEAKNSSDVLWSIVILKPWIVWDLRDFRKFTKEAIKTFFKKNISEIECNRAECFIDHKISEKTSNIIPYKRLYR